MFISGARGHGYESSSEVKEFSINKKNTDVILLRKTTVYTFTYSTLYCMNVPVTLRCNIWNIARNVPETLQVHCYVRPYATLRELFLQHCFGILQQRFGDIAAMSTERFWDFSAMVTERFWDFMAMVTQHFRDFLAIVTQHFWDITQQWSRNVWGSRAKNKNIGIN